MRKRETGYFAMYASGVCVIAGLENPNAGVVQLAATVKKNFEEPGV
jgi:hypothetical protein